MKYIIDIPDEKTYAYINDEKTFLRMPISLGENEIKSMFAPTMLRIKPYIEPDRKAIEDEVWEFATTCTKMDGADSVDVFGGFSLDSFTKYSYHEAKSKYEAWKKRKDEIRVGDEVEDNDGTRGIVFDIIGTDLLGVCWEEERVSHFFWPKSYCRKTGRHFDEVDELLKKMRGEQE